MRDEKGEDEKILGVPVSDPRFAEVADLLRCASWYPATSSSPARRQAPPRTPGRDGWPASKILRGHTRTFYGKQLAQQAVLGSAALPIIAKEIDVI